VGVRGSRPLWYHGLCSIGWGFLCLHWFAVQAYVWPTDELRSALFEFLGLLAAPPVVLVSALLYSRSRVRWWWNVAAAVVAAASLMAGFWLWHWPGHVRLENTRHYVAPTAFVLAWTCAGLLLGSIVDRLLPRTGLVGRWVTGLFALAAGTFGLLHLLAPDTPGLSDHLAFLFSPLVVLEAASFYAVIWIGARRSAQRDRRGAQRLPADGPAADAARLTDSDRGP
jgi:hypothetical protein